MGRVYAEVIGDPVAHSLSPAIHQFWLDALGIEADYFATPVEAQDLADYLAERRGDPDWRGCNLTLPHKRAVLPLLDAVAPDIVDIGAVNTVVRRGDMLIGHNSDGPGFMEPLGPVVADRGGIAGSAIVYGTGGAARAIVRALRKAGVMVSIAGRDELAARALAVTMGYPWTDWLARSDQKAPLLQVGAVREGEVALLVNATPCGMEEFPPLDISLENIGDQVTVYDIVYEPLETPLLRAARARGLRTVDGLAMLIGQAAAAFRLFYDAPAPRERDAELRALLTS